ncbi:hypothetical protein CI105_06990, partial [Candidatus Izimaplasma bacterium ZiA1]|uniref:sensor histidine kinase n=1 Tax=Candidatus Izimoplasma sp. ZiA1 TaxID=2024899 RepID=UPI000BC654B0
VEENILYLNIILVIIYLISIAVLVYSNKRSSDHINNDLNKVLNLIDKNNYLDSSFNYYEFDHIYNVVFSYLENIDLLTEQKEMNMKGLAHDVKTPLTIIYSYFDKVIKNKEVTLKDAKTSFKAAGVINELLNDLIDNNYKKNFKEINISLLLKEKVNEFSSVLESKSISVEIDIEKDIHVLWNEKDFSRVIDNIASNVFHYSKINSKFLIKAQKDKKINLTFTSEPNTINDVDIDKLFNKGFRQNTDLKLNSYGKGLGLYICKLLLVPVDGSISAQIKDANIVFNICI